MKRLRIKRVTPVTAIVETLQYNGEYIPIGVQQPYKNCKAFVLMNNEDVKTYRIAEYADRKDARRHLLMTIYARDDLEARVLFQQITQQLEPKRRELLTGDWKIITKTERK